MTRQSQSYIFEKFAKNSNFKILQWSLHATHLLKLLNKMCKYEMDPASYKLKNSNFWILKRALHATHLLKLVDKMCKYEMDPMSIVEDTERTRFCPQMDRRTDRQGDTSIPGAFNFVEVGRIMRCRNLSTGQGTRNGCHAICPNPYLLQIRPGA